MIVDIVDKLIDNCLKLIGYARNRRKDEYGRFIEEPYQAFCELHAEYLASFQNYRDWLSAVNEGDISSLIDNIRRDAIFSAHKRSGLKAALANAPGGYFSRFLESINTYLDWDGPGMRAARSIPHKDTGEVKRFVSHNLKSMLSNMPRGATIHLLSEICKMNVDIDWKRRAMVSVIDEVVDTLQELYSRVTHEFHTLRKALS